MWESKECKNKCCYVNIYNKKWKTSKEWEAENPDKLVESRIRAGVLIHDPHTNRYLLIRSYGNLWGAPKGGVNDNETIYDAAKRELFEETGISLDRLNIDLRKCPRYKIHNATYFLLKLSTDQCGEIKQDINDENDASGWTWIKLDCIDCLENLSGKKGINALTYQTRRLLFK